MGEVFSAQVVDDDPYNVNIRRGMRVAVKVVNRLVCDDLLMARLEREAQAARLIHSAYVPALLAVDRTPDEAREGQEELFLVMELLEGQSYSHRLKARGGYLSWEEVYEIGEDVLRGLMDAHNAGIVHRDLKPGNIFLARQPDGSERGMILDFGVCKLDGSDGDKLTVTGESLGTVSYMAPEQIRGASKVDERADLYSFAMVVFESLSGRLAHDATGQMAMLASKLERSARSIREVATVPIPAGLEAVLRTCLARKPGDRYPSAQELLKVWRSLGQMKAVVQPRPAALAHGAQSQPSFPHVGSSPGAGPRDGAGQASVLGTQTALSASTIDSATGHYLAEIEEQERLPGTWRPRRRTPVLIAAGAIAAAIMVMGAVALGRAPKAAAAADVPAAASTSNAAEDQVPHVAIVSQVPTPAADAATAEIDLDSLPTAGAGADAGAAVAAVAAPSPSRGGRRGANKKRTKDGFMSVAPF
jgi:serine/threonine-protein kinase